MVQDIRLALLLLPVGVAGVAGFSAAAVLAVITVVRGAGLTLGGEPLVVEGGGGGVEPGGGGRRLVVGVIGEDRAEDGSGGGGVVVVIGVAGEVEGDFLREVVVVVLKCHVCVICRESWSLFPELQPSYI